MLPSVYVTLRAFALLVCLMPSLAIAEAKPADKKRARELAAESAKAYKRGELEVSAALLKQAYALYPNPNLLYNLGRSLEGMGDKRGAVDAYTRYLAEAKDIDDRDAIERRISAIEAELETLEKAREPEPKPQLAPAAAPTPQPIPKEPPSVDRARGKPSKLPWIPIITGAAVLGAGGRFGYLSRDREHQAANAPTGLEAERLHDEAARHARFANVAFVGGSVLLVGGIVWKLASGGSSSGARTGVRASIGQRMIAVEWTLP
jgi:prepilin-type processing-associated H-X9-DG protein